MLEKPAKCWYTIETIRRGKAIMRTIHVGTKDGFVGVRVRSEDVPALYEANLVYACDNHDLHLLPDAGEFSLEQVEQLLVAIGKANP